MLHARLSDLQLVVADPALTIVSLCRRLDPGDRNEVRPERIRVVDVLAHVPSRVPPAVRPSERNCPVLRSRGPGQGA